MIKKLPKKSIKKEREEYRIKTLLDSASKFSTLSTDVEALGRAFEKKTNALNDIWLKEFRPALEEMGFNTVEMTIVGWRVKHQRPEQLAAFLNCTAAELLVMERNVWSKIATLTK